MFYSSFLYPMVTYPGTMITYPWHCRNAFYVRGWEKDFLEIYLKLSWLALEKDMLANTEEKQCKWGHMSLKYSNFSTVKIVSDSQCMKQERVVITKYRNCQQRLSWQGKNFPKGGCRDKHFVEIFRGRESAVEMRWISLYCLTRD